MKILFVSSEVAPFAASGGLGDVIGSLPACVASKDHEVRVVAPLYSNIKSIYRDKFKHLCDISFMYSWRNTGASVYSLTENNVEYLFIENHYYFDRGRLYGEYDDAERFAFFSMAVIEFMLKTDYIPDILHANDWQTAMAVVYIKTKYKGCSEFDSLKTVYTIHNIEYQGKFDPYILGDVFALDDEYLGTMVYDGCINLMKAAMISSDYVTTVSPNYANELEYDFFSFGLSDIVKSVRHKMAGVINGIDYNTFSPNKDNDIYYKFYDRIVRAGKSKNKLALCSELGLDLNPRVPLVVMITRLASQKGIDLFIHIADELLSREVQMIVLGTGDPIYENALLDLEKRYCNFRALIKFDRAISKKLYAAADIFLMPSKSEPCGLAQMIACSYGAVPVVRSVGGLYDTIIPYPCENSNGFRFDNYNAHDMLGTIIYAIDVYHNEDEWAKLRKRTKASRFKWDDSADRYISIYKSISKQ